MNDRIGIKGSLTIMKYKEEKLIEKYYYDNLITDAGLTYLLKLAGNDATTGINKLAIGNGNTPALTSDLALKNKLLLIDVQKDYGVAGRVNFLANIPANTFSVITSYTEAGLVCKTLTSELLITRLVFSDVVFQAPENSLSLLYSLEMRM